jgi:hypothetical protein
MIRILSDLVFLSLQLYLRSSSRHMVSRGGSQRYLHVSAAGTEIVAGLERPKDMRQK